MTRRPRRNHTPAFKAKVALVIDLQLGCAYMYVCSKRGRTLSGRSSLKKMEDMIHE